MQTEPKIESDAALAVAARLEDDEDQRARRLSGWVGYAVTTLCCVLALLAVKQVFRPAGDGIQYYLSLFLAGALPLTFLLFPARRRDLAARSLDRPRRERPSALDWVLGTAGAAAALYPIVTGFDAFLNRQALPNSTDVAMGLVLLVLILEATRRTTGWTLPAICLAFLAYGYYGSELPQDWSIAHASFDVGEIVNALYMSTSGFFGTPLDVAASYIVLFTIYGAVLHASGVSRFFVDLSFAAFRGSGAAPGRTVTMAGFLLGTVSGSGTAIDALFWSGGLPTPGIQGPLHGPQGQGATARPPAAPAAARRRAPPAWNLADRMSSGPVARADVNVRVDITHVIEHEIVLTREGPAFRFGGAPSILGSGTGAFSGRTPVWPGRNIA